MYISNRVIICIAILHICTYRVANSIADTYMLIEKQQVQPKGTRTRVAGIQSLIMIKSYANIVIHHEYMYIYIFQCTYMCTQNSISHI